MQDIMRSCYLSELKLTQPCKFLVSPLGNTFCADLPISTIIPEMSGAAASISPPRARPACISTVQSREERWRLHETATKFSNSNKQ